MTHAQLWRFMLCFGLKAVLLVDNGYIIVEEITEHMVCDTEDKVSFNLCFEAVIPTKKVKKLIVLSVLGSFIVSL